MLKELFIENLAVIKQVTIGFNNNLNVFTGETGAGKSILINGINAVLGQRTNKEIVRNGCQKASITGFFTDISDTTKAKLSEYGIDYENDEITLSRDISADGKNIARINSRAVTVGVLKEIGETLINIHGQHDNQILLKPERHIDILDSFGELGGMLEDYKASFKELQDIARAINRMKSEKHKISEHIKYLNEIIEDIGELELQDDEDTNLEAEYKLMANSEKLYESLNNAIVLLSGDDESLGAIIAADNAAQSILQSVSFISELDELAKRLTSASIELDDITTEINHRLSAINLSAERMEYVSDRLEHINKLKRKYGPTLSDVINKYNNAVSEIDQINLSSNDFEMLVEKKDKLLASVTNKAKKLSDKRTECAKRFINDVTQELKFLNMQDVTIDVYHEKGKLTITGMDSIEFLISANKGENPKPISKIASGGELSRIMLALKNVIADKDDIPTLIFDEIDTGVSGRAAQKIGIKLFEISTKRQVLCVTHLAQIAAMADNQLLIEKKVIDDETITQVRTLDIEGRKLEIARIIGGDNITQLTIKNASELIDMAEKEKRVLDISFKV